MTTANVYDFKTGNALPNAPTDPAPLVNCYPHWAFKEYPVAPDYASGNATGEAAALAFLKYLQSGKRFSGGSLQGVVIDWAMELRAAQSDGEISGIRGKMVGMFSVLEEWLAFAVQHGTTDALKNATEATLRAKLQDAAEGGPLARYSAKVKADKSEAARKAARARWDKHGNRSASKST